MDERTELGRIAAARFGYGGYQEAMLGLSLTFQGKGWGVGAFIGGWAIERTERCQWTEEDRERDWLRAMRKLRETLEQAKKQDVSELVGVPVECTFEGNALRSWRVLTEVLP